jgi:hypothetical protein
MAPTAMPNETAPQNTTTAETTAAKKPYTPPRLRLLGNVRDGAIPIDDVLRALPPLGTA